MAEKLNIKELSNRITDEIENITENDFKQEVSPALLGEYKANLKDMLAEVLEGGNGNLVFENPAELNAAVKEAAEASINELNDRSETDLRERQVTALGLSIDALTDKATHFNAKGDADGTELTATEITALEGRFTASLDKIRKIDAPQQGAGDIAKLIEAKIDKLTENDTTLDDDKREALEVLRKNVKEHLPTAFEHKNGSMVFTLEPSQALEIAEEVVDAVKTSPSEGLALQQAAIEKVASDVMSATPNPKVNKRTVTSLQENSLVKALASVDIPDRELEGKRAIISAFVEQMEFAQLEQVKQGKATSTITKTTAEVEAFLERALDGTADYKLPESQIPKLRELVEKHIQNHKLRDGSVAVFSDKLDAGALVAKSINEHAGLDKEEKDNANAKVTKHLIEELKGKKDGKEKFGEKLGEFGPEGDKAKAKVEAAYSSLKVSSKGSPLGATGKGMMEKANGFAMKNPIVALVATLGAAWLAIKQLFGGKTTTNEKGEEVKAEKSWVNYVTGGAAALVTGVGAVALINSRSGGGGRGNP